MSQTDPACTPASPASVAQATRKAARGRLSVAAPARTKISRDHFAFLRGWFNGLQARGLWERYLPHLGPYDERRARTFLRTLQHELSAVARYSGQPGFAGLLGRHKDRIADLMASGKQASAALASNRVATAKAPPSLDEFAAQFDEDMYSEAELIALWKEAYSANEPSRRVRQDATQRRARLIQRQLQALEWLERLACQRPQPGDPVNAWLDPRACARLATAGILTLGELTLFVGRWGSNWHKKVQRIGKKGAELIVTWLQHQQDSLGALPPAALLPAVQVNAAMQSAAPVGVPGLVPLERLAVPAALATADPETAGSNRASLLQCNIEASDDTQAIHAWLALRRAGSHTWRAYRREAERFLLWSVFEAGKPLSGLSSNDCAVYRDFLRHPGSRWVGPRNAQRWSPHWRPFEGALSSQSIKTAMAILQTMCEWLARRRYLDTNPWDGVPKSDAAPVMPTSRALTRQQWKWVENWLASLPQDGRSARMRLLLGFGYRTGMRAAELAAAKVEWLRHEQLEDGSWAWAIMVLGKANKWREVALPASAVDILSSSFTARGLNPNLLENAPETPLIAALPFSDREGDTGRALSTGRIYEVIRNGFERCAAWVEPQDEKAAARIRGASTHWLRHTYGTHAVETAPLQVIKDQMGHASLATTSGYTKAERTQRQRAIENVFG